MHNYKKLRIWEKAFELVSIIYNISKTFPDSEKFNLVSQLNRSAVSIVSNIAEGAGRSSNKSFINFLNISSGSCFELETQVLFSNKLGFIPDEETEFLTVEIEEISKMIYSFKETLREREKVKLS